MYCPHIAQQTALWTCYYVINLPLNCQQTTGIVRKYLTKLSSTLLANQPTTCHRNAQQTIDMPSDILPPNCQVNLKQITQKLATDLPRTLLANHTITCHWIAKPVAGIPSTAKAFSSWILGHRQQSVAQNDNIKMIQSNKDMIKNLVICKHPGKTKILTSRTTILCSVHWNET